MAHTNPAICVTIVLIKAEEAWKTVMPKLSERELRRFIKGGETNMVE